MGTTTVSLSILAGFTFGFLYLLISGIKWASERLEGGAGIIGKDRCARCGVTFVDVEDGTCSMCGLTVCTHCALHYQHSWLCTACVIKTDETLNSSEWVLSHFKKRFQSTVAVMRKYGSLRKNIYFRTLFGVRFLSPSRRKRNGSEAFLFNGLPFYMSDNSLIPQQDHPFIIPDHSERESDVRDFVEKLTEHLIGGRLDNVRIDRVCSHPNYTKFMDKYEQVLSLTLSRLTSSIQMLIDGVQSEDSQPPRAVHHQLKELITEIIEEANCLDLNNDETDKIKELRSKTYEDILAIAILNKASEKFLRPVSSSSYDNLDLDCGNKIGIFPELDSEFDDIVKETGYQDWNDNWHLEKKLENNGASVTMLIPSPNEEAKPKIGDVEVDELSDLSDVEVEPVHDIEDAYPTAVKETQRVSPMGSTRGNGFESLDDVVEDAKEEYLHYREPDIPSIVEARNNVFKFMGTQSGDETDHDKDRSLVELTHRNSTKVKIIEQAYTDRYLDSWRNRDVSNVSVRNLARHFSKDGTAPQKHSVNSLTCRNPARDHSSY